MNFVNEILARRCTESFKHYFQYKRETYFMRRKHQLQIPYFKICLGDRIYDASLWNETSNIMPQNHFKKCYRKHYKKFHISKYTVEWNTHSLTYSGTDPKPSQLALSWLQLFMSTVASTNELRLPWLPPAMYHLVLFMRLWKILWSLIVQDTWLENKLTITTNFSECYAKSILFGIKHHAGV